MNNDIFEVMLLADALRGAAAKKITLVFTYLPQEQFYNRTLILKHNLTVARNARFYRKCSKNQASVRW